MSRVLITGGSKGIGLAVAQTLAARGHELTLVARDADALEQATVALPGGGHRWHAFDVSDESAWEGVEIGELGGLVCAAAVITPVGPIGSYSAFDFMRTLEVNVLGTLLAIQHCLYALRDGEGSVVTFSGGGATAPLPRYDAYAISKAAVVRLTENLAPVIAPVPINCVSPGFVATGIHGATLAAGPEKAGDAYFERTRRELAEGGAAAGEAAELVCLLLDGVRFSGKLVSTQWDPWRDAAFRERLHAEPELGTIRRVDGVLVKAGPRP